MLVVFRTNRNSSIFEGFLNKMMQKWKCRRHTFFFIKGGKWSPLTKERRRGSNFQSRDFQILKLLQLVLTDVGWWRWFVQTVWCYEMSRVSPIMRILTLLFGVKLSGDKLKTAFYGSLQMWLWASDMSHMLWRRLVKNGRAWQTYSLGMFLWWAQTVSQFGTLPFMAHNK